MRFQKIKVASQKNPELDQWEEEKSILTATIAVFRNSKENGIQVLIGQRTKAPMVDSWALPGGHVEAGESAEQGGVRELFEETGVKVKFLTPVKVTNSAHDRAVKNVVLTCVIDPNTEVKGNSDLKNATWVSIAKIPELVFDNERHIFDSLSKMFSTGQILGEIARFVPSFERIASSFQMTRTASVKAANGLLIVFDGIDGSGKTCQAEKLVQWLEKQDYSVKTTKWNSSDIMADAIKEAKEKRILSPMIYSVMHVADMLFRYEQDILPALAKDKIVVADRYIYTSLVRDGARDVQTDILEKIYKGMREPDLVFHCVVPPEIALARLMKEKGLSYYGTGMDLGLAKSREESYLKYAKIMDKSYKELLTGLKFVHRLDMLNTVDEISKKVRKELTERFGIGKYD